MAPTTVLCANWCILLKYQRVRTVAPLLGRLLDETLAAARLPEPLLVVPVPLFRRKLRERGFNQAEGIARALVERRVLGNMQLEPSCLVRTRQTASQTGLTRHQRRANVRGAFALTKHERIAGKNVLVVDDVMTTGTTASECARILLQAGAKQVFVATVARAIREVDMHLQQGAWAQAAQA